MTNKKLPIALLSVFLFLTACTPEKKKLISDNSGEVVKNVPSPVTPPPEEVPPPIAVPPSTGEDKQLNLCSKLDLENVVWPTELSVAEWSYYALGLNITGSFEGNSGWKNLSGNFDGQGMSLGLMQQNFGQGTLQPWLIEMYKQYNDTMVTDFSSANYKSLKTHLESWQNSPITVAALQQAELASEELFPADGPVNKLDIGYEEPQLQESAVNSVSWAKSNILDSSGNVKAPWKKSFQDMAISPGYRSFQLAASTKIFFKAKQYFNFFNFHELRFLLFLFDIVVQNGSIQDSHLAKYNKWLASNPKADEKARALALLEARLSTVKPQYVKDVRSRKTAIINGTGTVHGSARNFPTEYCFDPRVIVQ